MVDGLIRKYCIDNGYLNYSLFFIPKAPPCEQNFVNYNEAKNELEAIYDNSSLKGRDFGGKAHYNQIIENITVSSQSCNNPPFNRKSKAILYLYALNNYVNWRDRDEMIQIQERLGKINAFLSNLNK